MINFRKIRNVEASTKMFYWTISRADSDQYSRGFSEKTTSLTLTWNAQPVLKIGCEPMSVLFGSA
jgi:hypothetical protein